MFSFNSAWTHSKSAMNACTLADDVSTCRSTEFWVISFVCKEWRHPCCCVHGIVVGKFGHWEKGSPIVLLVVRIHPQVLFQDLVSMLHLSVPFWVVTRCEV